jgi:hypothetical protein
VWKNWVKKHMDWIIAGKKMCAASEIFLRENLSVNFLEQKQKYFLWKNT